MKTQFRIPILIFIAVILFVLYALRNNTYAISESDSSVFKRNCGKCHSIERLSGVDKTSIGWEKTVGWMRKKQNTFSEAEGEKIKRYLKETHAYYPKIIFETKCAKCHSLNIILQQKRPPQEWDSLVKRERLKAITWITLDEAHDIAMYLRAYLSDTQTSHTDFNKTMADKKELTEKKCLLCHLYSTVFEVKRTKQQWRAINQRMQYKCPQWINEKEIADITGYLSNAVSSGK